ncbi:MAG: amino acid permease [Gammaproteobacteria bacterium]
MQASKRKVLSVFSLVMINVIAIDSVRGIPMGAHYGLALILIYIIFGFAFFIPSALVSAELATAWPQTGGIYVWVREAFGVPIGFLVSWIQWVYNICWYPTILSLLGATIAYLFDPKLADNTLYMLAVVLLSYWVLTAITLCGMRASGLVSSIAAILGTLLPMIFITILGIIWICMGKPINLPISFAALIPEVKSPQNLVLLSGIVYTLVGMEMSAAHAQDVKNPRRDYPRALLYSTIVIFVSLIVSSLAVALVLPPKRLDILTGLLDAFHAFFASFGLAWLMPLIAILIGVGIVGGVGAWMIGPTRGLLIAAQDGCVPPFLQKINKKNMPVALLLTQAIIVTIISAVFLVMPSVSSSFWILIDLTAQLAMSSYLFLFGAAIYLRYKHPKVTRPYKVPFSNLGMWIICVAGIIAALFVILIGYFPPAQIKIGNIIFYESFLILGFGLFYAIPLLLYKFRRHSWRLAKTESAALLSEVEQEEPRH